MKTPPKVKGHFLLGSLLDVKRSILDFLLKSARTYGDIFQCTATMLEDWTARNAKDTPINIAAEMMGLTTQIMAAVIFGKDEVKDTSRFIDNLTVLEEMIIHREFGIGRFFTWAPTPGNTKFNRAIQCLREETAKNVQRYKGGDKGKCLLSMLADPQNKKVLTDRELSDQALTFIQAGHETTATSLNWLFYFLARNPGVESKLRAELDEVLNGAAIQAEDLDRLTYLEMAVNETLRILPSAGLTGRQALQDDEIDGFAISEKSFVMMSPYVMQRTAAYWENPTAFEPERFTPDKIRKRHPYSYFPFLRGPHQCIGQDFALMEIRLIAATILQKYQLKLVSDEELRPTTIPILKIPNNCMLMNLNAISPF